jgi:hypothetical protein
MITLHFIRKLAESLPGSEEGTSYGTPAFRAGGKLFLRLHDKEDAIVVFVDSVEEQQNLISQNPESFYLTDHYKGYAAVLVKTTISEVEFQALVEMAWRRVARKRDIVEFEQNP